VNTPRRSVKACAAGSRRKTDGLGTGIGRRAAAMVLMGVLLEGKSWDMGP
jgi:hypothetical protein